jgi:hypothetical protein
MADNDIREGDPDKARKKKAPPPDDDDDDRPRKKRRPDDDEDDEAPRKKKKAAKHDDDDDDLGSSPLSAIIPVGGSIWALLSLYLSMVSCIVPGLWLISLLCGVLAFVTHKHKASYGSVAGNMRAILGIAFSLIAMVLHTILLFMYLSNPRMFR